MMRWETHSEEETRALGERLGREACPGEVIALSGDLGCGKTVFTRGFAAGMGVSGPVTSPTFTILQIYEDGRLPLYHFDVYRLGDVEEMEEIGYEEYVYGEGVSLIEWADLFPELLPPDALRVTIKKDISRGGDYRIVELAGGKEQTT